MIEGVGGKCEKCGEEALVFKSFCGAVVCENCGHHQGLAKCFCGWNIDYNEGEW